MKMTARTRRITVLGLIFLGALGAYLGEMNALLVVAAGLIGFLKDDSDGSME